MKKYPIQIFLLVVTIIFGILSVSNFVSQTYQNIWTVLAILAALPLFISLIKGWSNIQTERRVNQIGAIQALFSGRKMTKEQKSDFVGLIAVVIIVALLSIFGVIK